jgi:hypothetical protein
MLRIVTAAACAILLFSSSPNISIAARAMDSPHDYFNALVARPEYWKSYSLRDQRQLATKANGGYAVCNSCPLNVTYDPANDPDPRRQDAAKVLIPADALNLRNWIDLPIGTTDGTTYLATWDVWFGAEWAMSNAQIRSQKTFQFTSDDRIWYEMQSRFHLGGRKNGYLAELTARGYALDRSYTKNFGPNVTEIDPLSPQVGTFMLKAERWTRYWTVIDQRVDDYDLTSLWIADEQTGPVHILDRLQLNAGNGRINGFWLEFNTSASNHPPDRGPLVAYVRNLVLLRNVANPISLMLRPNASEPLPPPPNRPAAPRNLRIIPPPW